MTNYVLVHGGNHAAWCWELVLPYLKQNPQVGDVLALDLVGHGLREHDKLREQITPDDYVNDIAGAIMKRDLREVIIAGHSMGGAFITGAAARVPGRVKGLVFISALIPPEGESIQETWNAIGFSADPATTDLKDYYRQVFCQDMDEATTKWFLSRLGTEPPGGMTAPVSHKGLSPDIAKIYILLTRDQVLSVEDQRHLAANIGITQFAELAAGHNAMISHPRELAEILLRYV